MSAEPIGDKVAVPVQGGGAFVLPRLIEERGRWCFNISGRPSFDACLTCWLTYAYHVP